MADSEKKKSIKRSIDLEEVKSLDKDLRNDLLEFYTGTLNKQEERDRNALIEHAKGIFAVKKNLVKGLGDNDAEREAALKLVSAFPTEVPTTDKGWSRVIGIIHRGGKKKNVRTVEFPADKPKSKAAPKKSSSNRKTKAKTKASTKK